MAIHITRLKKVHQILGSMQVLKEGYVMIDMTQVFKGVDLFDFPQGVLECADMQQIHPI